MDFNVFGGEVSVASELLAQVVFEEFLRWVDQQHDRDRLLAALDSIEGVLDKLKSGYACSYAELIDGERAATWLQGIASQHGFSTMAGTFEGIASHLQAHLV